MIGLVNVRTVHKFPDLLTGRVLHLMQCDLAERKHVWSGVVQVSSAGGRQVEPSEEDDSPPAQDYDTHDPTSYPMVASTR